MDLEDLLGAGAHGYFAGGAGDEITLRANETSWSDVRLAPRVLVDVGERDLSVDLLGRRRSHPVVVAPMAYQRHAHEDAERGTARAAAATGSTFVLSSQTTTSPAASAEEMAASDASANCGSATSTSISTDESTAIIAAPAGGEAATARCAAVPGPTARRRCAPHASAGSPGASEKRSATSAMVARVVAWSTSAGSGGTAMPSRGSGSRLSASKFQRLPTGCADPSARATFGEQSAEERRIIHVRQVFN